MARLGVLDARGPSHVGSWVLLPPALLLSASARTAQGIKLNGPLALAIAGDVTEMQVSPDGSRVVYLADQDADELFELCSVPLAGGAATQLNPALGTGRDVQPGFRISPDSSRVVYLADQDANDVFELFSVPIAGGSSTQLNGVLVANADVRSFLISPDSSRVVYRADQDLLNVIELYSVPLAGGAATKLNGPMTPNGDVLNADDVVISPDSSRVVYRADQDADQVFELFSAPIAGGGATQLNPALATGGDVQAGFQVSLDASRAVYRADQDVNDVFELFSVPLAGGSPTQLNPVLVAGGDVDPGFRIAPDSSRVAYTADQIEDGLLDLFSVPLAGGAATILDTAVLPTVRIAPDSSRVVYHAFPGSFSELFSVPLAGGTPVQVSVGTPEDDFQISPDSSLVVYRSQVPPGAGVELSSAPITGGAAQVLSGSLDNSEAVTAFAITPDSGRVVYCSDQDADEVLELFSVPIAGGTVTQLNPPLVYQGDVQTAFLVSAGSTRAIYRADQTFDGVIELYSVPVAGGAARRLNPTLAPSTTVVGYVRSASLSPDRRRAVYLADQEVEDEVGLYSVELPLGPPRRIDVLVSVGRFVISPDSRRVVYARSNETTLHCVSIEGGPSIVLDPSFPPAQDLLEILISPDSQRVLFRADQDGVYGHELYSVPIGGGTTTRLDSAVVGVGVPRISADSTRVVYLADQDTPGLPELYSVPIAGGPSVRLNPALLLGRQITPFELSPDSSRVVYRGDVDTAGVQELYSVPIAGGPSTKLNPALVPGGDVHAGRGIHVSRDSSRVVYGADQDTDEVFELYRVPLAGGSATKLNGALVAGGDVVAAQSGIDDDGVAVSPDSDRVVYVADEESDNVFELYSVPLDGSAPRVKLNPPLVSGGDACTGPEDTPFGPMLVFAPPRISPDGAWVVYEADQDVNDRFDLYSVPIAGGPSSRLNATLPAGEALDVDYVVSTASTHVLYRAGVEFARQQRFHAAPLDGSGPPTNVDPPLPSTGQVWTFEERGGFVIYLAEQDQLGVTELYLSFLGKPIRRAR